MGKACCYGAAAREGSCTADLLEGVKVPCGARVQKLCPERFCGAVASSACHDAGISTFCFCRPWSHDGRWPVGTRLQPCAFLDFDHPADVPWTSTWKKQNSA